MLCESCFLKIAVIKALWFDIPYYPQSVTIIALFSGIGHNLYSILIPSYMIMEIIDTYTHDRWSGGPLVAQIILRPLLRDIISPPPPPRENNKSRNGNCVSCKKPQDSCNFTHARPKN